MPRFWAWIARHTLVLSLGSAATAVILLAGGIALGVQQTPTSISSGVGPGGGRAVPVVAQVSASRHSVSGVIVAAVNGRALVRNPNGTFFGLVWGPGAHIRANGRAISAASLRPGDRVLAIGTPTSRGVLRAAFITVTGHVTLPPGFRLVVPVRPGVRQPARTPTRTPE